MKTLTLLSTAHIQTYIYEKSSRLKENVGASRLVKNAFEEWEKRPEKIFVGGGNAALEFAGGKLENAVPAIQKWSRRRLDDSPGLRLLVHHHEFEEGQLAAVYLEAQREMEKKAGMTPPGAVLGALPVSRTCPSTGLAAEVWDAGVGQWISREAKAKRDAGAAVEYKHFPKDFEELGVTKGESLLAVVHADGNGIGKFLREYVLGLSRLNDRDFKQGLADISGSLSQLAKEALEALFIDVEEANRSGLLAKIGVTVNPEFLPIRPLVHGGDDVTFVTHGKIGLALAARYLANYERLSGQILGKELHACAGVAIIKQKYPFARAYQLAEELTSAAKLAARKNGGSYLDFQLHIENTSGPLPALRAHYHLPGGENLLKRPYCITDGWKEFQQLFVEFKKDEAAGGEWPRSAAKLLLETLPQGQTATKALLDQFQTQGRSLPNPSGTLPAETGWRANSTPYFDPLEMLDHHEERDWNTGAERG